MNALHLSIENVGAKESYNGASMGITFALVKNFGNTLKNGMSKPYESFLHLQK